MSSAANNVAFRYNSDLYPALCRPFSIFQREICTAFPSYCYRTKVAGGVRATRRFCNRLKKEEKKERKKKMFIKRNTAERNVFVASSPCKSFCSDSCHRVQTTRSRTTLSVDIDGTSSSEINFIFYFSSATCKLILRVSVQI